MEEIVDKDELVRRCTERNRKIPGYAGEGLLSRALKERFVFSGHKR